MTTQNRYSRQSLLPEVGEAGQAALAAGRVLIVGVGGLGCPAALYLAGAGVGRIGLLDGDTVDQSNLQRQVLFTEADCGQPKVQAAAIRLRALNSSIHIEAHQAFASAENIAGLLADYDVVIDGSDNFACKFLLNDAAVKLGKPLVYGALFTLEGQVAVFDAANGSACYRCLYPEPPKAAIPNCAEAGVIGALAGTVGSLQALEAIKLLVNSPALPPSRGVLWTLDARDLSSRRLRLPKRHDCAICSVPSADIVLQGEAPMCASDLEIAPDQLDPQHDLLIDVREPHEHQAGHPPGCYALPLSRLREGTIDALPAARRHICFCTAGIRSREAASRLREAGHTSVYSLRGGWSP